MFDLIDISVSEEDWVNMLNHCADILRYVSNTPIIPPVDKKDKVKPTICPMYKWSGGKRDELAYIVSHIPEHELYVEPFVGAGALMFHLQPKQGIINDIHEEVATFYRACKSNFNKVMEYLDTFNNTEEDYYRVRSIDPRDEYECAARFWYLRQTCFRGMLRYNSEGKFNIPYGKYKRVTYECSTEHLDVLKRVQVRNEDFMEVCRECDRQPDPSKIFVFMDPPYDSNFSDYKTPFSKSDHLRLATWFKQTKCRCLMVIGETMYINSLYRDYIVGKYMKKYAFKLYDNRVSSSSINNYHLIIKNY